MFAKKSLGQNFLTNPDIRDRILEEAGNIAQKNILEIGPGLGFLTTALLKENANITAVELDPRTIKILKKDFGHKKNFQLIEGDILQQDIDSLFKNKPYSVIANIPYNITAPLLRKILANTTNHPDFIIFMVQKEVANKLTDKKKNSILKISVDVFGKTEKCFEVSRECFNPIPKVDSAIIKITTHKNPLIPKPEEKLFFNVVNAGFSQKRKKLGNFIGKFFGTKPETLLGKIDPNRRAETLSIQEWKEVANNLKNQCKK